jgi:WD40 repeat protein
MKNYVSALIAVTIVLISTSANLIGQDIYLSPLKKYNAGSKRIKSLSFSPTSKYLSILNSKDEISIWEVDNLERAKDIPSSAPVILHRFYDDDKFLVLDNVGKISKYNISKSTEFISLKMSSGIKEACIDPSNQYVVALLKENLIEVFDLKANMTSGRISVSGNTKEIGYLGYDRFGQQIVLISNTGDAYSWNALNQKFLRELKLRSSEYADSRSILHSLGANSGSDRFLLAMEEVFIPQGGFMAPTNRLERRNWVVSYDWLTGQEIKKMSVKYPVDGMTVGPGPFHMAYFSANSQAIILLNLDKSITSSVVAVDEKPTSITLSPDNQYLAVGTIAGNVYIYEIVRNDPAEVKITSPKLNRNFGEQLVKEPTINIEGYIEGSAKISKIYVNSVPAEFGADKKFSAEINLSKGKNRVRIGVQNSESIMTEKDFYLTYEGSDLNLKSSKNSNAREKRMALVIGNSNYAAANKLPNTLNDAKGITTVLNDLGFEVTSVYEGTYEKMKNEIYAFGEKVTDADVSLFYYAGHGLEVDGINYLIPVDATIESALDVKQKAIPLIGIQRTMEFANDEGLNMIILDACRNNPFPTGKRGGTGLAKVTAPSGTLIAYATDPGSTASDGDDKNGLYTGELIKQLKISQRIEDIFMNTRNAVERISSGKQRPWEEARLRGIFYLK